MNVIEFLESLREPVQTMGQLPAGAVNVYAQQSMDEVIGNVIAQHNCAVLIGLTGGRAKPDRQITAKSIPSTLEVEVWTPEVILTEGGVQMLPVLFAMIAGLHGYAVEGRLVGSASAWVPAFNTWGSRVETARDGSRYLVGNAQFDVICQAEALPA